MKAVVDIWNGNVRLTLPIDDKRGLFFDMTPVQAHELASALEARAHSAELWSRMTAEEAPTENRKLGFQ